MEPKKRPPFIELCDSLVEIKNSKVMQRLSAPVSSSVGGAGPPLLNFYPQRLSCEWASLDIVLLLFHDLRNIFECLIICLIKTVQKLATVIAKMQFLYLPLPLKYVCMYVLEKVQHLAHFCLFVLLLRDKLTQIYIASNS